MSKLPVSRVVNVAVQMTPAAAQSQSLNDLLLLGTSAVIDPTERMRAYGDLAAVAGDFGTSAEEYLGARAWFSQSPQPRNLYIGRWVNASIAGGLLGSPLSPAQQLLANFTAITTGAFQYELNGGALTAVTGLDFSGAANLNAVAGILQTAMAGVTVIWNASMDRFEFTSTTLGATSSVSYFQAPVVGVDISDLLGARNVPASGAYIFQGQVAESIDACLLAFDDRFGQQWYGVVIPSADQDQKITASGAVQGMGNKHVIGHTTQEPGTLVATTTDDLASQLRDLSYSRTFVQFSSTNPMAAISAFARILTTNYNAENTVITLKFKQEPGVVAESLSSTQANTLNAKRANYFVNYNNDTAILQEGVMSSGNFADEIMGVDWLAVTIQRELYNLLYTSLTKIPQTDPGQNLLITACEAVCSQGVTNGLLAPAVWNSGGFGTLNQGDFLPKGYYVYSASFSTQFQADRVARKSMPIQIAAKLAGAIHFIDAIVNVNQ